MTKVAIKNENITSYGGIYHIMDVFSKLGFEKLTESVSISLWLSYFPIGLGGGFYP